MVQHTELFTLAESLGAVESLIEHPGRMTHASASGSPLEVPASLVRLSVGLESASTWWPTSPRPSTGSEFVSSRSIRPWSRYSSPQPNASEVFGSSDGHAQKSAGCSGRSTRIPGHGT